MHAATTAHNFGVVPSEAPYRLLVIVLFRFICIYLYLLCVVVVSGAVGAAEVEMGASARGAAHSPEHHTSSTVQ
ncbi:hypothetical protein EJ02DRAFT_39215 [Clathrospora elynae]|uniref:Uncharacterized protein n=1 Tax=Clathrospora elynae TaxID=706981 RepID=A0A6A5SHF6_9PLEO|nr:hypothetical protein EJ02DRAFT_39215 [Clathrospora elynae]